MPGIEPTGPSGTVSKEVAHYVVESEDLFDSSVFDPVLARKMALINTAIDKIGMTPFQWKLFFLNGFGYTVDSVRNLLFAISQKRPPLRFSSSSW